jgi:hypothetical protein
MVTEAARTPVARGVAAAVFQKSAAPMARN